MRKYLWAGAVTVPALVLGLYGAAGYAGRHPDSILGRVALATYRATFASGLACGNHGGADPCCSESANEDGAATPRCTPTEPDPLTDLLPLQPLPASEPSEPIHVEPPVPSSPPLEASRTRFVQIIPAVAESVDDCPTVMPRCYDETEAPPLMPLLIDSSLIPGVTGSVDPRKLYWLDLPVTSAASPEKRPAQRRVDTMEFRPSDARRGEFDPIPF